MASVERIQMVNLSKAYGYNTTKRSKRAVALLKEFVGSHTKAEDVVLSNSVNSTVWARGNQKPPRRIKVRIVLEEGVAKVYLPDEKIEEKKKEEKQKTGTSGAKSDKKEETPATEKTEKAKKKTEKEQPKEDKKEDKK